MLKFQMIAENYSVEYLVTVLSYKQKSNSFTVHKIVATDLLTLIAWMGSRISASR